MIQSILNSISEIFHQLWSLPLWLVAAVSIFLLSLAKPKGLTKQAKWRPGTSVRATTAKDEDGKENPAAKMVVTQMMSDIFSPSFISLLTRFNRLTPAVETAREQVAEQQSFVDAETTKLNQAKNRATKQPEPTVSPRGVTWGRRACFAGDIAVMTQALLSNDAELSVAMSLMLALALSCALFFMGKLVGHGLREVGLKGFSAIALGSALLISFTVSLALMRQHDWRAWLVLSLAPAIGAALLIVLGPSEAQWAVHRTTKAAKSAQRKLAKARKRCDRKDGRHRALFVKIDSLATRDLLAAKAEAHRTGVTLDEDWRALKDDTNWPAFAGFDPTLGRFSRESPWTKPAGEVSAEGHAQDEDHSEDPALPAPVGEPTDSPDSEESEVIINSLETDMTNSNGSRP